MMRRWWAFALLLWICFLPAYAQANPQVVALIVGSNRSSVSSRPDLRYADDDAARYDETFRSVTERDDDVELLTRFDRDSQTLFAPLQQRAIAPTRANLQSSVRRLAVRVRALRALGREVDFYFVFAGHGDVDRGQGFLELEDGAFASSDVEDMLREIAPTRAHVFLDSCNSLFVISARKPGGHVFESGEAAAKQLKQRLPQVGVFLSTSADGEVFEWSELGAGIFSHVVRSGIAGAADANGDGAITYAELRAYVDIATRSVKNPRYRPRVFAAGPGGRDEQILFRPKTAKGRHLTLGASDPRRVTVRDADGIPWADVHCEASARCALFVPERIAHGGFVDVLTFTDGVPRLLERRSFPENDEASLELASLSAAPEAASARGPGEIFRALFHEPFGPRAYAQFLGAPKQPDPVYGISRNDIERFGLMLDNVSRDQRNRRYISAATLAVSGAALVSVGVTSLVANSENRAGDFMERPGYTLTSSGAGSLLGSGVVMLLRWPGERLSADFQRDLRLHPHDPSSVLARAEAELRAVARQERNLRWLVVAIGGAATAIGITGMIYNELRDNPSEAVRASGVNLVILPALFAPFLFQMPAERMLKLWQSDPARPPANASNRPKIGFGIGPTRGGAAATLQLHY